MLAGCASTPSFWDDNESYAIAKIRHSVEKMDCSGDYRPQALELKSDIRFLELYSSSKGSNDLLEMVEPMMETADGLINQKDNTVFCNLKKKQLEKQAALIAEAVMERF